MMEKYSTPNRSITSLHKLCLIFCILCVNGVPELLIKNDSNIRLELHNEKYLANQNRTWVLSQDTGVWVIYFLQFSLEAPNPKTQVCEYDFLKIRESRNSREHEDTFCGNQIGAGDVYYSKGPRIELQFKSDDRNEMPEGFEIQAFHAETKGELMQKLKQFQLKIPTVEDLKAPMPNVDEKYGPSVLIIGLTSGSVVVSIIFVIIFIYFIKAMQKPRKHLQLHNILIADDTSMAPLGKKNVILLGTGRRYSKDKEKPTCSKSVENNEVLTNGCHYTSKCSAANYDKTKVSIQTRLKGIHEASEARPENVYVQR